MSPTNKPEGAFILPPVPPAETPEARAEKLRATALFLEKLPSRATDSDFYEELATYLSFSSIHGIRSLEQAATKFLKSTPERAKFVEFLDDQEKPVTLYWKEYLFN